MKRMIHRNALAALALLVGLGCASSKVNPGQRYAEDVRLERPPVLLVYDFAVCPADVVQDSLGAEFSPSPTPASKELKQARIVAATLSDQLVDKLSTRGIRAKRAIDATLPPLNAIVFKGEFVSIDRGSRTMRMVVGFGLGATELRVNVQKYQAAASGLRRIADSEAVAKGAKMPGMAVPVAGGAIAGTVVTSAVISGGLGLVREVQGDMTDEVGLLADAIAKHAEAFYRRQGWL